jgi:NAD(P)-dependent dehydrogenase (short-subunit alcohol dehydrogenase family)|tara:strand:- start:104 stop:820 length:717 start_codon:yes stop_codon:yes gene_type:complete
MSKKHLIFGATGAIGSSLAHQLNDVGEQCHLIGRNETELKELSSKLNCKFSICDVLDPDFTKNLKDELSTQDIAGIAYCIGSIDLKPFRLTKTKDFISCFTLNLVAVTEIIKIFEENLKKNNGSIVLFSTVAAQKGFTNHSIISSAKAAVEGLTVSLAAEFAPKIKVNCIAPSLTNSKIAKPLLKNKIIAEGIAKSHPLKRIGEGKDAASMARFLLTQDSSWITGQIIGVDGGRSKIA